MKMEQRIFPQGELFHICNKSIAGYGIFKDPDNIQRFIDTIDYYNNISPQASFSKLLRSGRYNSNNLLYPKASSQVKILCYCIMPDHYHLLLKVLTASSISKYISDIENSYTRFFNIRWVRKGPLWQSRFRAVRIESEEQLLHTTRYIHLNPTTANLVRRPEDWLWSSYKEYISNDKILKEIVTEISIKNPARYKKFVENRIDYQKKLKLIKKLMLERSY